MRPRAVDNFVDNFFADIRPWMTGNVQDAAPFSAEIQKALAINAL
jgi:hypothetical protein